ncbi:MAG: replication initiation protein [Psychrobacter sp.]|nr:replication initiation protein [Psychrobacter sp.]
MTSIAAPNQLTEKVLREQLLALNPARRIVLKFMIQGKGELSLEKNSSYKINNQSVRDYYREVFKISEEEASTMLHNSVSNLASSRNRYWFDDEYGTLSALWFTSFFGAASADMYSISLSVRVADAFNKIGIVERDKLLDEYTKPPYLGINPRASRLFQLINDNTDKNSKRYNYEVGFLELRNLLGISDSYEDVQNFKKFVLHPAIEEIGSAVGGEITYTDVTEGRKILGFVFNIKKLQHVPEFIRKRLTYPSSLLGYPNKYNKV